MLQSAERMGQKHINSGPSKTASRRSKAGQSRSLSAPKDSKGSEAKNMVLKWPKNGDQNLPWKHDLNVPVRYEFYTNVAWSSRNGRLKPTILKKHQAIGYNSIRPSPWTMGLWGYPMFRNTRGLPWSLDSRIGAGEVQACATWCLL